METAFPEELARVNLEHPASQTAQLVKRVQVRRRPANDVRTGVANADDADLGVFKEGRELWDAVDALQTSQPPLPCPAPRSWAAWCGWHRAGSSARGSGQWESTPSLAGGSGRSSLFPRPLPVHLPLDLSKQRSGHTLPCSELSVAPCACPLCLQPSSCPGGQPPRTSLSCPGCCAPALTVSAPL